MDTEEHIFQGSFYCAEESKHKHSYLHKVFVTLSKVNSPGVEQERFSLNIRGKQKRQNVIFSASELCYVETDETEVKKRNSWSGFDCFREERSIQRRFSILWIVIQQKESLTLRFLQDGDFSKNSDNGLDRLKKIIDNIIGKICDWFGHSVDSLNNFYDNEINQRLVATPRNMCVLNWDMKTLNFHLIENKDITIKFDANTSIITIDVNENCECTAGVQNFVRVQSVAFYSRRGKEIKQKLEDMWKCKRPCHPIEMPVFETELQMIRTNVETTQLQTRGTGILFNRHDGRPVEAKLSGSSNGHVFPMLKEPSLPNRTSLRLATSNDATESSCESDVTILKGFDSDLPLPAPCSPTNWGQFVSTSDLFKSVPAYSPTYPKPIPKGVLRTQSFTDLKYQGLEDLEKDKPNNLYEDYYNYRIYYNMYGYTRYKKPSMRKKIQRRSRLSSEIEDVDFRTVDKHEVWYDQSFRGREDDENYRRVNKIYEAVPQQPLPLNITSSPEDDPYWNSDLCLTVQYVMENKKPELCKIFDISFTQMVGICVHLSVEKTGHSKDWRDLAEILGLNGQDIEVVQHFCFKYHEWTAEVILIHWVFEARRKRRHVPDCSYETLKQFLTILDRDDLLTILQSVSPNNDDYDEFWEENTKL